MKLSPVVTSAILLTPVTVSSGWLLGPSVLGLYDPFTLTGTSPSDLIRKQQNLLDHMGFQRTSPSFNVQSDDSQFKVLVKVPDVKTDDIHIKLDKEKSMLHISGKTEKVDDSYSFKSTFSHSMYVDPTVHVDDLKADLKDGMLTISAPRDMKQLEQSVQRIPITQAKETSTPEKVDAMPEEVLIESD
jgi:HSP20 family protein